MKDKFTKNARAALNGAKNASKKAKQNYIGTEHILLGLLKEGTGVAGKVLHENGVEFDKVMELIEELIAPASTVPSSRRRPSIPSAEKSVTPNSAAAMR